MSGRHSLHSGLSYKEFLREFLRDFLQLFFPEVEAQIDFTELRFLDSEAFTSFPEGSSGEADVVAEVRSREKTREILLIHVEVEARKRSSFPKRMFQYYSLLWSKYDVPIFPIVVYLRGGRTGLSEEQHVETLFGWEHLTFRYKAVSLARLEAREYLEKSSPVAAALAALMSRRARKPAQLWLTMTERLNRSGLDEARKLLLLHIINTYLVVAGAEEQKLERALSQERYREVRKMQMTWAEKVENKGRKEGREEGRIEGMLEGKREALLRLLTAKFGPLPDDTASQVRACQSLPELDRYLDQVLVAGSLAEMKLEADRSKK